MQRRRENCRAKFTKHSQVKICGHSKFTRCGNCGCDMCMLLPPEQRHVSRSTIFDHGGILDANQQPPNFQQDAFDFIEDVDEVVDESPSDDVVTDTAHILRKYARRICLDVYYGQTQKETERDLERLQLLFPVMDEHVAAKMPRNYYQCIKIAELPPSTYDCFDVCQNNRCGKVFPFPEQRHKRSKCEECDTIRYDGPLSDHSLLCLNLEKELKDFYSVPSNAEMLTYCLDPEAGIVFIA